ncbi:MAG: thermonuclease [Deltaproteobacteria bacterium]|nr:MAG: thermonuclease [Deltaproteobacteria bacterium]
MKGRGWLLLLLWGAGPLACGGGGRCGPGSATVQRVIDGDTVELADGRRVRYLLIDAPENTSGHNDCYGAEATAYNRALVEGRRVQLEYDVECSDRYDRLLAYVRVDGQEVNARLVEQGYACVYYIPPNGQQRQVEYQTLEAQARAAGRGMWGECQVVSCDR